MTRIAAFLFTLSASTLALLPMTASAQAGDCPTYQPTRQPLFGELHLHTQYSVDAATLDTRNTPADAYRYAKGFKVGLPPFINTANGAGPTPSPNAPSPQVSDHPYCLPGERCEHMATRSIQLPKGRALDFAAITDHAEYFGESNICLYEPTRSCSQDSDCRTLGQACVVGVCAPRDWANPACVLVREEISRLRGGLGTNVFAGYVATQNPARLPFCKSDDDPYGNVTCRLNSQAMWGRIKEEANKAYEPCRFTSLIAYEYTATPGMGRCTAPSGSGGSGLPCWASADCTNGEACSSGNGAANLHRNIIFKNDRVPLLPVTNMEAPTGCGKGSDCLNKTPLGSPQVLLAKLEKECVQGQPGCDFISIPHNSNLSGGAMFREPESAEEARLRATYERLAEITQIKGQSECRFSPKRPGAWGTLDENCQFEAMSYGRLNGIFFDNPGPTDVLASDLLRNALSRGLAFEQKKAGAQPNPFKVGFVGALDNHNGTPSATDPADYATKGAHGVSSFSSLSTALNQFNFLGLETNPGGLTGVWAEENTRESIFAALKRRETFATSGTRPVVRFFGGFALPSDICQAGNFPAKGYAGGVPMGGTLDKLPDASTAKPTFAVSAVADPGWIGRPGTRLQQVQIIKGWVDAQGATHEKVVSIAGNTADKGRIDPETCAPNATAGATDLCAVWTDAEFNPGQKAFYYARVLENESCRWNQFACNAIGVSCKKPMGSCGSGKGCMSDADCQGPADGGQCLTPRSYTDYEYQQCCSGLVPSTVQQRAWTSPIFYNTSSM